MHYYSTENLLVCFWCVSITAFDPQQSTERSPSTIRSSCIMRPSSRRSSRPFSRKLCQLPSCASLAQSSACQEVYIYICICIYMVMYLLLFIYVISACAYLYVHLSTRLALCVYLFMCKATCHLPDSSHHFPRGLQPSCEVQFLGFCLGGQKLHLARSKARNIICKIRSSASPMPWPSVGKRASVFENCRFHW